MQLSKIDLFVLSLVVIPPPILISGNQFLFAILSYVVLIIYFFRSKVAIKFKKRISGFIPYVRRTQLTGLLIGAWVLYSPNDLSLGVILCLFLVSAFHISFTLSDEFKRIDMV